jgi:hypothetical protein
MITAHKGRRAEWKTRDHLQQQGYVVVRAAGSKGAFDVIAWNQDGGVLIQVKVNRLPSPEERRALLAVPVPPGFRRLVYRWDDRAPEPIVRELRVGGRLDLYPLDTGPS